MFLESSLIDLYNSTILGFPNCPLRQHATHTIKITNLHWTPFVGMKTLFVKGLAQNEGREYNPIILFKRVNYGGDEVIVTASDGREVSFDKLSTENTDVLVRCNCADFRYRFSYYNFRDRSLYGRKGVKYESKGIGPPANLKKLPGVCKHLMQTAHVLREAGIFQ